MNFKNTCILTIFSVISLEFLSSCGNKATGSKPAPFSGSYKLVALACGTIQSTFTPENGSPNINTSSYTFNPFGFGVGNLSTNRDFKIKHENGKYSFVYSEMKNNTKCIYYEELDGSVSRTNASIIKLESKKNLTIVPRTANDPSCPILTSSPFSSYYLFGEYSFAKNNGQYNTLTSETNDYCKVINQLLKDEKLIITLKKE